MDRLSNWVLVVSERSNYGSSANMVFISQTHNFITIATDQGFSDNVCSGIDVGVFAVTVDGAT